MVEKVYATGSSGQSKMAAATSSSIGSMRDFWKTFDLVSLQVSTKT